LLAWKEHNEEMKEEKEKREEKASRSSLVAGGVSANP
jgi:hypothetical protein